MNPMRMLVVAVVVASCFPRPGNPEPVGAPGSVELTVYERDGMTTVGSGVILAPGDSLPLTISWGAATRATGYRLTVTADSTNGTWSNLPTNLAITTVTRAILPISTTWDSVRFTARVESVDAFGPTGKFSAATWKMRRRAGAPGPIIVDSSQVPQLSVMEVRPSTFTLTVGASRQMCAFPRFASGRVAMRSDDATLCTATYLANFSTAERAVSVDEQKWVDCVLPYACPAGYRPTDTDPFGLRYGSH